VKANLLAIHMNSHSNLRLSAPDLGADPRVPGGPGERTRDAGDEVGRPARALDKVGVIGGATLGGFHKTWQTWYPKWMVYMEHPKQQLITGGTPMDWKPPKGANMPFRCFTMI
jgi:hypothetical protein